MVGLKLDIKNAGITEKSILKYSKEVEKIHTELHEKKDDENEFLGWLELPTKYNKKEFKKIKECAKKFKQILMCYLLLELVAHILALEQ